MSTEIIDPRAVEWSYRGFIDNLCVNTKRGYERDLAIFSIWRCNTDALEAIQGFVRQGLAGALDEGARYSAWLFSQSWARRTAVRRLAALRSLIAQLESDGAIRWSLRLPSPPATAKDRQRDRDLGHRQTDVQTLSRLTWELASNDSNIALRDRLIVYFGWGLLLRNVELHRLRLTDIDWRRNEIAVQGITTRNDMAHRIPRTRPRKVPIPSAILPDLREWVDIVDAAGGEHLFVQVRWGDRVTAIGLHHQAFSLISRRLFKRVGVRGGNMRALRAGGITTMLDQMSVSGGSPADVADLAGLSDLAQLRRRWMRGNKFAQRVVVETAVTALGAYGTTTVHSGDGGHRAPESGSPSLR